VTDETKPVAGETPAPAPAAQPSETPAEEPFDKDRAMALIAKLRDEAKDAKALKARLDKLDADAKKAKDAELSETEQLKKRLAETEAAAKDAQDKLVAERRRSLVVTVASAMHANDPQDANILQVTVGVDPDATDAETQVKKIVGELAKAKPYLFRQAGQERFNPGANGTETDAQRMQRLLRRTGQASTPFG
jgi:hypothetical protein